MDNSWGRQGGIENTDVWIGFPLFDRLLRLDCGGFFCKRTFEIWQEMRALALNDAFISEVLDEYVHQLGDSGAYAREADRWGRDEIEPDGTGRKQCVYICDGALSVPGSRIRGADRSAAAPELLRRRVKLCSAGRNFAAHARQDRMNDKI